MKQLCEIHCDKTPMWEPEHQFLFFFDAIWSCAVGTHNFTELHTTMIAPEEALASFVKT